MVEREGRRIAALVHDPALNEESELVESVCAAAALALENERLQAELRARLEELRASRARIVEAADEERRRIERNLHDGTQQRLVSISMALGLAQAKLEKRPGCRQRRLRRGATRAFGRARGAARAEPRDSSGDPHRARTRRGAPRARPPGAAVPVELAVDGS